MWRTFWSQSTVSIHLQMTVSIHNLALKIKLCYNNFFYIVPFHYSSKIIAWNLKWCQQEETLRLVYPLGWQKNESHKWSWCQMPYLWQRNGLQQYQVAHPLFALWNKLSIFEENFLSKRMLTLHIKIVHTCDEYDSDVGRKKMFFYFEKPFLVWLCIFSNSTSWWLASRDWLLNAAFSCFCWC